MKYIFAILLIFTFQIARSQSNITLSYRAVPAKFFKCGAVYTFDSISISKKKFVFAADFQDQAVININGKNIKLLLTNSTTEDKVNISVYKGASYIITTRLKTVKQAAGFDLEEGFIEISDGKQTRIFKIHGRSSCKEESFEKNG